MKSAAIDLAFARDSSALTVVEEHRGMHRVIELREVRGGDASDPRIVVADFIATLEAHEIKTVMADCHYRKLLEVTLAEREIGLLPEPAGAHGNTAVYLYARRVFAEGRIEIPEHPLRARLVKQLRDTRGKPLASGAMQISHSRESGGGHGDLVSALVLALWQLRDRPVEVPLRVPARSAELTEESNPKRRWAKDGEPLMITESSGRFDGFDGDRYDGYH